MIIRLQIGEALQPDAPTMALTSDRSGAIFEGVSVTPELAEMFEGSMIAYFEAEWTENGWDVLRRVPDPGW